jgi:hypothetical protein
MVIRLRQFDAILANILVEDGASRLGRADFRLRVGRRRRVSDVIYLTGDGIKEFVNFDVISDASLLVHQREMFLW